MSKLNINSDFTDYYDVLSDKNSIITYNRFLADSKQRGTALKYLRSIGIKTVELKQVNKFFRDDGPIIVYTNPKGHHGEGKKILSVDEALQSYENSIACKYYEDTVTIKYVQIGKRRFTLCFQKFDPVTLNMGRLISIRESTPEYNRLVGLPIFSIDYISNGHEMLATDFNEVENLQRIGMNNYISARDVVAEIEESLKIYNKA